MTRVEVRPIPPHFLLHYYKRKAVLSIDSCGRCACVCMPMHVPVCPHVERWLTLSLSTLFSWNRDSLEPGACYFKAQLAVYLVCLPSCFCPHPHSRRCKPCWTSVGVGDPSLGLYTWKSSALTHWTISSALLFGVQLYSLNLLNCINSPSSHFWIKINWKDVY